MLPPSQRTMTCPRSWRSTARRNREDAEVRVRYEAQRTAPLLGHNATRIGHGHLLGGYSFHAARLERSFHVSIPSGHFTYPNRLAEGYLTASLFRQILPPHRAARVASDVIESPTRDRRR